MTLITNTFYFWLDNVHPDRFLKIAKWVLILCQKELTSFKLDYQTKKYPRIPCFYDFPKELKTKALNLVERNSLFLLLFLKEYQIPKLIRL